MSEPVPDHTQVEPVPPAADLTPPTTAAASAERPSRQVRARRVSFQYEPDLPRHYVGGDLVMSHVVAMLSAMFPNGEDFFVRSVRRYRDEVTDPELRAQVAGFIGQEAMHGREHRAFNERLQALGYPTGLVDRLVARGFALADRVLPARDRLAITAALEHYTATLAEVLMTDESAQAALDVPEVRALLLWHALEEAEHKAVAFDVFEQVCGKHWVRTSIMRFVTAGFVAAVVASTAWSLLHDPASRDLRRLGRSLAQLRRSPWLSRAVRHRIADYNRRGFHPDDWDATALLDRWRAELFGSEGRLRDRLAVAAPAGAGSTGDG